MASCLLIIMHCELSCAKLALFRKVKVNSNELGLPNSRWGGQRGIVEVAGPFLMLGYLSGTPSHTFAADEWFRTSDQGYFDETGQLHLTGRVDQVIITGGLNVHPSEVENVLLQHPDVTDAVAYGQPDPTFGNRIHAVVTTTRGKHDEVIQDLMSHCRRLLARHKRPSVIHVVDELPKGPTGKVLRGEELRSVIERA
ncbi:MAG: hypothetical protein DIU79_12485 [Actinobacteria bacterium]|nr:MAG: hypothetical protein DIU79_12485 [Actinomycetota bacterium]